MSSASGAPQEGATALLTVSVSRRDGHRAITWLALGGLLVAALMGLFGLPPVDLHGPLHRFGVMDPLCGGTRSAWLTTRGDLAGAWRYNPLGIVTVVGSVLAVARAGLGLVTGRWLSWAWTWTPRRRRVATVVALVLVTWLEVRQQLRADLLIADTWTF